MNKYKSLMVEMHKIQAIKFGKFTLKSGMISPFYIDLRVLVSAPKVLKKIAQAYVSILKKIKYKRMVAIPYTALPIVANISALNNKPWIYTRKEVKEHGIKRLVEGEFKPGERVILVDDMITTGGSKIEVLSPIEKLGLVVKDVVVLVDREQGGREQLEQKGYRFHCVFTMSQWLKVLLEAKKISKTKYLEVIDYIDKNKVK